MWSAPGSSTNLAPGMCSAAYRPCPTLLMRSFARCRTKSGDLDVRQDGPDVDLAENRS